MIRMGRNNRRSSRNPLPGRVLGSLSKGTTLSYADYPSTYDALSLRKGMMGTVKPFERIRFSGFFMFSAPFR